MKKNKVQKDILYISISSFVLVVLWIGFNLYHTHATSTIEPYLQLQIQPIAPQFDMQTINNLKSRKSVSPVFELDGASSSAIVSQPPANEETTTIQTPSANQETPGSSDSAALNIPEETIVGL